MCQYPGEMWVNNSEHVGLATLNRLLDQPSTNLQEVELWQLVTAWATDQCHLRDLSPTAANQRALINQAGILNKVRFLTFSPKELSEIVEPSGLLSDEEIRALRSSITVLNSSNKLIPNNATNIIPEGISLPVGFNSTREMRKRFMAVPSRCFRYCLTKRKKYSYGGVLKSKVSADSRVLVTGFEVFTRIATTVDYIMSHGSVDHYLEDLVMSISDEEGNLINRTEVSGLSSVYNVTQVVTLSEPVWFSPKHEYTVEFKLENGQYPLSDLSSIAFSKAVCFRFTHSEQIEDTASVDLDVSFINGIFFSV